MPPMFNDIPKSFPEIAETDSFNAPKPGHRYCHLMLRSFSFASNKAYGEYKNDSECDVWYLRCPWHFVAGEW